MKKVFILLLAILSLSSCQEKIYFINGAGYRELNWGSDSNLGNNFHVYPEFQHTNRGRPYLYYGVGGAYYYLEQEQVWRPHQLNRYDRLYQKAIEKGINPHVYIDRWFNEGESNSR